LRRCFARSWIVRQSLSLILSFRWRYNWLLFQIRRPLVLLCWFNCPQLYHLRWYVASLKVCLKLKTQIWLRLRIAVLSKIHLILSIQFKVLIFWRNLQFQSACTIIKLYLTQGLLRRALIFHLVMNRKILTGTNHYWINSKKG